ncbi:hypothetical protein BDV93DRAFT_549024, partial [Ceratobasidium sp. AG-I]
MNSTLVRIRVQTAPPLEPLKAWHTFSPDSNFSTIRDLAGDITSALGLLLGGDISLELDGFVLLPTSPVGAVRDGDTIIVKYNPPAEKRKATEETERKTSVEPQKHKKQRTRSPQPQPPRQPPNPVQASSTLAAPPPPARATTTIPKNADPKSSSEDSSSDSSDASSSESDSDSDSESDSSSDDSDSDSDSGSDSGSSSSSDSAPAPQSIPRKPTSAPFRNEPKGKLKATSQQSKSSKPQPLVPPGLGKPSTKDRNARRRKLRTHQMAGTLLPRAGSTAPSANEPASNGTPAPAPTSVGVASGTTVTTTTQPAAPIAPAKSANKNKRRGFDKDMASAVATRVTFGASPAPLLTPIPASPTPTLAPVITPSPTPPVVQSQKSRYTHYHVVPPSQRSDLPPNVIVTSVDVEAVDRMEDVGAWFEEETTRPELAKDSVMESIPEGKVVSKKVDWEAVDTDWEKKWDSFGEVGGEGWKTLKVGNLVGWKALMLDPTTCTPCTRIHLARINRKPDILAKNVECFVLERPGAGDVGFGFGGRFGGGEVEEESDEKGEEDDVGEVNSIEASEMIGWKILG